MLIAIGAMIDPNPSVQTHSALVILTLVQTHTMLEETGGIQQHPESIEFPPFLNRLEAGKPNFSEVRIACRRFVSKTTSPLTSPCVASAGPVRRPACSRQCASA